jgi:hypothetical protein
LGVFYDPILERGGKVYSNFGYILILTTWINEKALNYQKHIDFLVIHCSPSKPLSVLLAEISVMLLKHHITAITVQLV